MILYLDYKNLKGWEVVLQPGDVLYIPPLFFHYVCVAGNESSMSISTHTDAENVRITFFVLIISLNYEKLPSTKMSE